MTIRAGSNIILVIGTIGHGAGINGVSIGDANTGSMNATGTDGITGTMMTKSFSLLAH
jgi:hypothetical protein